MSQKRKKKKFQKRTLVNSYIKFPKILLIDSDKKKIGIMSSKEALKLAESKNLDLFCLNPNIEIPPCEIGDYSKYKYEQKKNLRKNKKSNIKTKQIRLKGNIAENDILVKSKKAIKFLEAGNKVKISMALYGRQFYKREVFLPTIINFAEKLTNYGTYNSKISQKGRFFDIIVVPIKNNIIK